MSVTRSSSTSTSPISADGPTSTLSQPGGSPASCSSSASRSAESGVCDAGFSTTAHPAASAGAILCATRLSGKLNGLIAPTTPIGTRMREGELPLAGLRSVHRHHLAGERARLDGRHRVRRHRARDLDAGRLERLAGLGRDLPRRLVGALARARRRRGRGSRLACAPGAGLRIARSAASTAARASAAPAFATRATSDAVVGRGDLDPLAGLDPLAVEEQLPLRSPSSPCGESTACAAATTSRRQ